MHRCKLNFAVLFLVDYLLPYSNLFTHRVLPMALCKRQDINSYTPQTTLWECAFTGVFLQFYCHILFQANTKKKIKEGNGADGNQVTSDNEFSRASCAHIPCERREPLRAQRGHIQGLHRRSGGSATSKGNNTTGANVWFVQNCSFYVCCAAHFPKLKRH